MATVPPNAAQPQQAPSSCALAVAKAMGKSWNSLPTHEQEFIEFACATGWSVKLIVAEIKRRRKIGEIVSEGNDQQVEINPDNVDDALDAASKGASVHDVVSDIKGKSTSSPPAAADEED